MWFGIMAVNWLSGGFVSKGKSYRGPGAAHSDLGPVASPPPNPYGI